MYRRYVAYDDRITFHVALNWTSCSSPHFVHRSLQIFCALYVKHRVLSKEILITLLCSLESHIRKRSGDEDNFQSMQILEAAQTVFENSETDNLVAFPALYGMLVFLLHSRSQLEFANILLHVHTAYYSTNM